MANLFAVRATDPHDMLAHPAPIGPDNDSWLNKLSKQAGVIVAAWGTMGNHMGRDSVVCSKIKNMQCLRKTKDGFPGHPLYLPCGTELKPMNEK